MEILIKISKGVDLRTSNDLFTPLPTVKQGDIVNLDIHTCRLCMFIIPCLSVVYCSPKNQAFVFVGVLCWSLF